MNNLENAGIKIVRLLQSENFKAFFVGGYVRNQILKIESDNIDISTDASPDEVEKILERENIKVKPIGKKFGSILAIVDDFPIEITTFRSEGRYSDNRHPDQVEFIREYLDDAKRRDFTINALYFDPIKKQTFDPVNGLKDLNAKLLRFVGDSKKRIDEDALRMLRGVRLATQLGFKLEKNSFAAIKTRAKYIQGISGERIKAELDKILLSENRVSGIELLDKTGLMRFIIPEMEPMKDFSHKSKKYHLEGNMFNHTLLAIGLAPENADLNLLYALLFHDIGKPRSAKKVQKAEGMVLSTKGHADISADIFLDFASRTKFSRDSKSAVEWLIRNHMLQHVFFQMKPNQQLELANNPNFLLLLEHWNADHYGNKRADENDEHSKHFRKSVSVAASMLKNLKTKSPLIYELARGSVIMKYSKLKGPALGDKIEDVKVQIVLGKIENEKDLENYLKS